jgi:predicted ATPase
MARKPTSFRAPFLKRLWTDEDALAQREGYPFDLPLVRKGGVEIDFNRPVTVIVGENGTGKSTILEAIGEIAGFGKMGGTRFLQNAGWSSSFINERGDDGSPSTGQDVSLSSVLRCSWLPKITQGFFFRAETFVGMARQIEEQSVHDMALTEGRGHLRRSHAEGFFSFFEARFSGHIANPRLFIFDEPESALSPRRQIDFLKMIRKLEDTGLCQMIIATHSPVLMAYPQAQLLRLSRGSIDPCSVEQTDHFRFLREFYQDPAGFIDATMND